MIMTIEQFKSKRINYKRTAQTNKNARNNVVITTSYLGTTLRIPNVIKTDLTGRVIVNGNTARSLYRVLKKHYES